MKVIYFSINHHPAPYFEAAPARSLRTQPACPRRPLTRREGAAPRYQGASRRTPHCQRHSPTGSASPRAHGSLRVQLRRLRACNWVAPQHNCADNCRCNCNCNCTRLVPASQKGSLRPRVLWSEGAEPPLASSAPDPCSSRALGLAPGATQSEFSTLRGHHAARRQRPH